VNCKTFSCTLKGECGMNRFKNCLLILCFIAIPLTILQVHLQNKEIERIRDNQLLILKDLDTMKVSRNNIKADHDTIKAGLKRLNNGFAPESEIMNELTAYYIKELLKRINEK
jgi:hypothetical protein